MKKRVLATGLFLVGLLSMSCDNDDANPVVDQEVITTLTATFVPQGGGQNVVLTYRDLNGTPVITPSVGQFQAGVTYNGSLQLLNELESPAEDINVEIEEKDLEHQFFFSTNNNIGSFNYVDFDVNGKPIGLEFTFNVNNVSTTGNLTIILRHDLDKNGAGVSLGNIANAGGETDIEVTLPIQVVE
ncbi:MAG: type 1 periplasmic binding fold superfamily protein [Flavobacterium sp.]